MLKNLLEKLHEINTERQITPDTFTTSIEALRSAAVANFPDIRRAEDDSAAGHISTLDAYILYNLVTYAKPKTIFEIGTWIGTSSMAMADALLDGTADDSKIYTCDKNNFYSLGEAYNSKIERIHQFSDQAIAEIPADRKVDFVFADGELTASTLTVLLSHLSKDAIIATHDFKRPGEKGVRNLIRLQMKTRGKYVYILPKDYGSSIAVLLPIEVAMQLNMPTGTRISRFFFTIYLFITANTYLLSRRFYRKIKKLLVLVRN